MADAPSEREAGTWERLRRRKVVQWGIAYVAGAWGFLQGLEYVSESFGWPGQLRQVAILALLVGLPIALVVAWYHGDRGAQRVSGTELTIISLLFLLGGGIFWRYDRAQEAPGVPDSGQALAPSAARNDSRPAIAVLPFENRSRLDDDEFFVDGIYDDILTRLSKFGAMKVIARTSVEQFRDTRLTTRAIGEKLGVTKLLTGGVQRAGDRVRVTVQLVDTPTDAHLWAESYDRELTAANIFAIQSEIGAAIADALEAGLTPAERAIAQDLPTLNLQAWESYQLGRQRLAKFASSDLAEAEQFFRQAIELDPKFALAYVGLADSLAMRVAYGVAQREAGLAAAETALAQALELNPDLAEGWATAGMLATTRWKYDRAAEMFQRAIEINPNSAPVRQRYSQMLRQVGRRDESLAQMRRAVELDPLSSLLHESLGAALEEMDHFHEAEAAYRKSITIDPSRPTPHFLLALLSAYALDRFADAVVEARKATAIDPDSPNPATALALLYFDIGDDDAFVRTTSDAAKRWPDDRYVQYRLALIGLMRHDVPAAVLHARRALDTYPRYDLALALLRNVDLENGRFDAALARYRKAYPEFFEKSVPEINERNYRIAIDLAIVFQKKGDAARAEALLDAAAPVIQGMPRLGIYGHGIADVQILALRGRNADAVAALREAERVGWRYWWRYYRDFESSLAAIRHDAGFKAAFANIERRMAEQRAELAARSEETRLDVVPSR